MIEGVISWSQLLYTVIFGCFLYYFTQVVHKPKLHCKKGTSFHDKLKEHLKELEKEQWPLLWCFWPLCQAFFHTLLVPPQKFPFERKEIFLKDGGTFTLDFFGFDDTKNEDEANQDHDKTKKNQPIIFILPGATGHSRKVYVREFIASALSKNYRAVCLNFRGWGRGVRLKTGKLSCVSSSIEIEAALSHISNEYPDTPIMAIASSVGACTFVNYLARHGTKANSNLTSALLLGVPWDPVESKRRLSKFWNNLVINRTITKNLINQVKRNLPVIKRDAPKWNIDLEKVLLSKTVWDFDDTFITPLYGYKDHMDLYKKVGLVSLDFKKIGIPVVALCTEDDPLCRGKAIPYEKITATDHLAVITTKYGGHLTWLEGIFFTYKRFPHRVFDEYTDMIFEAKK